MQRGSTSSLCTQIPTLTSTKTSALCEKLSHFWEEGNQHAIAEEPVLRCAQRGKQAGGIRDLCAAEASNHSGITGMGQEGSHG